MLADGAVWIRVAEDKQNTDGVWIWHPRILPPLTGNPATLQRLKSAGLQRVDTEAHPALAEVLQGQLAPLIGVQVPGRGQPDLWAQAADIEHALAVPVVLAFPMPGEMAAIAGEHFECAQTVPPRWLGMYGLAVVEATRTGWTTNIYGFHAGDDGTIRDLRTRLEEALISLAGAAQWPHGTPKALEPLMQPGGYERQRQALEAELQKAGADSQAMQQYQAGFDMRFMNAQAIKAQRERIQQDPAQWAQEWKAVHEMAMQLAEAYWTLHQAASSAKPRKLPQIAQIFDDMGQVQIPSAMPIYAITQAHAHGKSGEDWESVDRIPTFTHSTPEHTTAIQVRPDNPDTVLDDATIQALWAQVRDFGDLDADVFLAMLAQAMQTTPDEDGCIWITGEHILDNRGIQPKVNREGGRERRAGHRQEDLIEVARCVGRQANQWVVIRSQIIEEEGKGKGKGKPRKRLYTHESRLTQVVEAIRQHELLPPEERTGTPSYSVAWRYRMGTWLGTFIEGPNRKMAWLCQQALRYDPYHEQWEKRLARYFMFHLRINAKGGGGQIVRGVGKLIRELGLPIDERNPDRTRRRYEAAMNRLVDDGQIESWAYTDDAPLPARKWLETWLERSARITAAPITSARYASIPAHIQERQGKAATLRALRDAKGDGKGGKKSDA